MSKEALIKIMVSERSGTPVNTDNGLSVTATPARRSVGNRGNLTPRLLSCEEVALDKLVKNGEGMDDLVDLSTQMGYLTATLATKAGVVSCLPVLLVPPVGTHFSQLQRRLIMRRRPYKLR